MSETARKIIAETTTKRFYIELVDDAPKAERYRITPSKPPIVACDIPTCLDELRRRMHNEGRVLTTFEELHPSTVIVRGKQ